MNYDCLQTYSTCFRNTTMVVERGYGIIYTPPLYHKENFSIISKCRLKHWDLSFSPKHGELGWHVHCNVILNRVESLKFVEWMIYIWAELLIRGYVTYIELIYIANYVLFGYMFGFYEFSIPSECMETNIFVEGIL